MSAINEMLRASSHDSVNSITPLTDNYHQNNHQQKQQQLKRNNNEYIPPNSISENIITNDNNNNNNNNTTQHLHATNNIIIKQQQNDLKLISIDIESDKDNNNNNNKYSRTNSSDDNNSDQTDQSITHQTLTMTTLDKQQSLQHNPLDFTQLRHQGDDIEIGAASHTSDDHDIACEQHSRSPIPQLQQKQKQQTLPLQQKPHKCHNKQFNNESRMPSVSYNNIDNSLSTIRRSSRRKWWSPTRLCDWCMHKSFFGKLLVMTLSWTTIADYGKDFYVAYHLFLLSEWLYFSITLCIMFLSLRLMLYLRATDDSGVSFSSLLIFYLPGSVYADSHIDRFSDIGVCLFWELIILFGTPFVPFYLIYLSLRKSYSLFFSDDNFENEYLLSYAVIEALFSTIPQLIIQSYLYLNHYNHNNDISIDVFIISWCICIIVLIKIPIVLWYNWRIVYKLSFKRRHCGEIKSIKYHPIQDIIATGSWDHTVLINSIIDKTHNNRVLDIKAKRVLDHHYNINYITFKPTEPDIIAVAGQGIELFNWRNGKSIISFPKIKVRDQLRRRKRLRTREVRQVLFSNDGKRLIWCCGKNILIWDIINRKELCKIRVIKGGRLGDIICCDISPNDKYIACGLYQPSVIKVYNSYNKDLMRTLTGHTSSIQCIKFDRYGKYIISASSDNTVRVFDFRYGYQIKQFNKHTSDVLSVSIDYTNRYIASGGRDKILYITYLDDDDLLQNNNNNNNNNNKQTEIKELRQLKGWKTYSTERDILCTDFSPYGDTIGCADEDHKVHILSLPDECHTRQHRLSQ